MQARQKSVRGVAGKIHFFLLGKLFRRIRFGAGERLGLDAAHTLFVGIGLNRRERNVPHRQFR